MPKIKRPACLSSPDYEEERVERSRRLAAGGAGESAYDVRNQLQLATQDADEIPDEERGCCEVNLMKRDGEILGLTVSGGADRDGKPKISNLRTSGIAAKSDLLQAGDYITSVNGIKTCRLKHGEIISLLKNIGEIVKLNIEYVLPPTTVTTSKIVQKSCDVTLHRDNGGFGFVVRGGHHERHCLQRPLVVTHVRENSSAEKEGSMKTGDRILAIESFPVTQLTLEEMMTKMGEFPSDDVTFTIEYDVSVMDSVSKSSGALMVEVYKAPREELGIALTKSTRGGRTVVCIDRVKPASIADRCGALHVGDQVLSIDAVSMTQQSVNLREASELLQSSSDQLKIEILPFSRFAIANKPFSAERYAPSISSTRSLSTFPNSNTQKFPHLTVAGGEKSARWRRAHQRQQYRSAVSLALNVESRSAQMTHTETHHVRLLSRHTASDVSAPNFGIQLFNSVFTTEVLGSAPVIAAVEAERSADICGVIQAGDRLISVNGFTCEEYTVDDVNQLLAEAYHNGQVDLEIEFDVGDAVVASSGIFHAKLPARRGVDIGIELSSGADASSPIIISKILTGSMAHRSGTLSVGDQLLAVDGFRWLTNGNGMTVDYARTLLANSDDVLRLKIQKNEDLSDEDNESSVTYTVELKRHGGPLGITISGTEDPYDPIIISQLTPNSLAARTGAIHEEDEILSINSKSLKFLTLTEAIEILQNATDVVTFKIKRALKRPETTKPDDVISQHEKQQQQPPVTSSSSDYLMPESNFPQLQLRQHEETVESEPSDPEDEILPPPMTCIPTTMTSSASVVLSGKKKKSSESGGVGEYWEGNKESSHLATGVKTATATSREQQDEKVDKLLESLRINSSSTTAPPPSGKSEVSARTTERRSRSRTRHQGNSVPAASAGGDDIISDNTSTSTWGLDMRMNNNRLDTSSTRTWAGRSHRSMRCQSEKRNQQQQQQQQQLPLADWQRALDDLQSVGQSSQYLADLENNFISDPAPPPPMTSQYYERRAPYLQLPPAIAGGVRDVRTRGLRRSGSNPTTSTAAPPSFLPLKFHKIIITRDHTDEDFGFSLSDGQTESGIYVHTIRPNSPAHRAGLLPYDRILQVNGSSVSDSNSRLVIYIISANINQQQPHLILFISRYGPGGSSYMTTSMSTSPHQRHKILLSPPLSPPVSASLQQQNQSVLL